ncbi:MAG TPA: chemotaxis protein CheW [Kofleriaceae bacterium]|nr:chemotaxis protein CheW [Kofleriaceae bacterium]
MTIAIMPVQLASIWIAVGAVHLQEVRGAVTWVPLPGAPAHLPGVVPWRGRAIAVLDLGGLLGVAPPVRVTEPRPRTLIAQVEDTTFAIPADTVREVHTVVAIEESHAAQVRHAYGQVVIGGQVMPVIDLAHALAALVRPQADPR